MLDALTDQDAFMKFALANQHRQPLDLRIQIKTITKPVVDLNMDPLLVAKWFDEVLNPYFKQIKDKCVNGTKEVKNFWGGFYGSRGFM